MNQGKGRTVRYLAAKKYHALPPYHTPQAPTVLVRLRDQRARTPYLLHPTGPRELPNLAPTCVVQLQQHGLMQPEQRERHPEQDLRSPCGHASHVEHGVPAVVCTLFPCLSWEP